MLYGLLALTVVVAVACRTFPAAAALAKTVSSAWIEFARTGTPVAEKFLNRDFEVVKANRVWVSDITYTPTAEGWLYLCRIMDLYSGKIVGWSMSPGLKSKLVIQALIMAMMPRKPPRGLIFHSDRGSQYCIHPFRGWTRRYGIRQSMSGKGDCWDKAPEKGSRGRYRAEYELSERSPLQDKLCRILGVYKHAHR